MVPGEIWWRSPYQPVPPKRFKQLSARQGQSRLLIILRPSRRARENPRCARRRKIEPRCEKLQSDVYGSASPRCGALKPFDSATSDAASADADPLPIVLVKVLGHRIGDRRFTKRRELLGPLLSRRSAAHDRQQPPVWYFLSMGMYYWLQCPP